MKTHTELQENTAKVLQELLTRAYDAEQGFQHAADSVKHNGLKSLFEEYSAQRRDFGHDLKSLITASGETPDKGASVTGKLHQFWIDLRGKLSGGNESGLLEECRRGEETTISDYADYIADECLTEEARDLLNTQVEKVRSIYSRLTSLQEKAEFVEAAAH